MTQGTVKSDGHGGVPPRGAAAAKILVAALLLFALFSVLPLLAVRGAGYVCGACRSDPRRRRENRSGGAVRAFGRAGDAEFPVMRRVRRHMRSAYPQKPRVGGWPRARIRRCAHGFHRDLGVRAVGMGR